MKLVDANVLLNAVNPAVVQHERAKRWLESALTRGEAVLLPWVVLLAFLRTSTHPSIFPRPLSIDAACELVRCWQEMPNVVSAEPDGRHAMRMHELLSAAGSTGGNLVNDAHLAALALQYKATVVTFDNDFGRFPGVRWESPH